jgi:hypothetical protein
VVFIGARRDEEAGPHCVGVCEAPRAPVGMGACSKEILGRKLAGEDQGVLIS